MTDGHDIVERLDRLHAFLADREDADVYTYRRARRDKRRLSSVRSV